MKEKNDNFDFGNIIRTIRERRNLSIRSFATLIGVSATYLSDLENNKRKVTLSVIECIRRNVKLTKLEEEKMMKSFSHDRLEVPVDILYYLLDNELIDSIKTIKEVDNTGENIKRLALSLKK